MGSFFKIIETEKYMILSIFMFLCKIYYFRERISLMFL
jgi:hypothetical protein